MTPSQDANSNDSSRRSAARNVRDPNAGEASKADASATRAMEARLLELARVQRADLAYAASLDGGALAAGEERLRAHARAEWSRPRRSYFRIAAAAAVLLFAGWFVAQDHRTGGASESQPPVMLGQGLACVAPLEGGSDFTRFAWTGERRRGASFELTIRDEAGREIARFSDLESTEFLVPADQAAAWPDRIEWTVEHRDASGSLERSSAHAWRNR